MIRLYNRMDLDHAINFDHDEFSQIIPKEQFFFFSKIFSLYIKIQRKSKKNIKTILIDFPRQNMFIEETVLIIYFNVWNIYI